jgi:hypothetical protein
MEVETYDGEIMKIVNDSYRYSVTILDPNTIKNKVTLEAVNKYYNPNVAEDFFIQ